MPMPPQSALSIFNVAKLPAGLTVEPSGPAEAAVPLLDLTLSSTTRERASVPQFMEAIRAPTKPSRSLNWRDVCVAFWVAGVCVFAVRLFLENLRFRQKLRRLLPVRQPEILQELKDCAAALGFRKCP